jgi:large subunit ribosomal protein L6
MSRIGRKPIAIPAGVKVKIDGQTVTVSGPKGELTRTVNPEVSLSVEDGQIQVTRQSDEPRIRGLHGLVRTLVSNMVEGVSQGYKKDLEVSGVGYRVAKQGSDLVMNLGFSHQIVVPEVPGISIEVPSPNKITISGHDKQQVGQFAAEVRGKRPPEPYKGKGIKYAGEVIIRKEGKAGKGSK